MSDTTISNICETVSTWGGASASGLSTSANLVVEKFEAGLATQTAAVNEYVSQIGTRFRDLAAKAEQYADQVSSVGERSIYRSAAEYYANEANKLLDTSIDASRRLNDLVLR